MYISLCEKIFVLYETFWGMKLYQRFSEYISATLIISAIFKIYRRNSNYISDFLNISTYQQKTTIIATYTIKRWLQNTFWNHLFFTTLERVTSYLDYKIGSGSSAETSLHLHANQLLIYHP